MKQEFTLELTGKSMVEINVQLEAMLRRAHETGVTQYANVDAQDVLEARPTSTIDDVRETLGRLRPEAIKDAMRRTEHVNEKSTRHMVKSRRDQVDEA